MKRFSEYINNSELDDNIFISEGFINKLAKFTGNTLSKLRSVANDIKNFSKATKIAFKGMNANLVNDDDPLNEEERKKIIERITSKDINNQPKEIESIINDYKDNEDFKKSGFACYILLYGKQISVETKDENLTKFFDEELSRIDKNVKQEANKIRNDVKDSVENDSSKSSEEINKEKVDNVISSDPIKDLAKSADIDSKKLYDNIFQQVADDRSLINNVDDAIKGLSAIVCGAILLRNNDKIKEILNSIGISDSDEFINKIKKVAN